jgi:ABC-2 type transport system ATP-binding protein
MIGQLKGKITILLTTHYMEEAQALADRIAIMHAGQLLGIGSLEQLTKQANLPSGSSLEEVFVSITEGGSMQ